MMRIAEYDEVDPLQVLHLNLLCLEFALTPERVARMRQLDPRPFPCFATYAVAGDSVAGQVGVFRLPVISSAGATEVGGVWAVCTQPAFHGQGVASSLLDEAHARMAGAGLRYSTLGTSAHRVAYSLYRKHGYRDLCTPAMALAHASTLPDRTQLRAERAGVDGPEFADRLFAQIARGHLGFARRHTPFFATRLACDDLDPQALWLLWQDNEAAGYATISRNFPLLVVSNLLLAAEIDPVAAVAALVQAAQVPYVQVRLDSRRYAPIFVHAGFHVTEQSWGTFMVKPLAAGTTIEEFRQLYGVDGGRFLISGMDVT